MSRRLRKLWPLTPAALLATVVISLPGAGPASATNTTVTLTPITVAASSPTAIDYYSPTNELVMSVNQSSVGQPNNLAIAHADGTTTPFGQVSGIGGEVYVAGIRTSSCEGGFTPGDVYFGDGHQGGIGKLSAGGTALTDPWVTLPGESGMVSGGLSQDVYCVAGGDLIVTTTSGKVWRVTSAGQATLLASTPGCAMEGPTTVPSDPVRYGPWSGQILVADECEGYIWSIDPTTGSYAHWDGGGNWIWGFAEGVHVVPPRQNFFGVDSINGDVAGIPASQLTGVVGDVVLATEFPGQLLDIRWDGSSFQSYNMLSSDAGGFEGTTFAPAGLPGVPAVLTDPTTLTVNSGSGDFADAVSVSGTLVDTATSSPVSGQPVTFTLDGTETCSGITDSSGLASCSITPGEAAGSYTLAGSFAGSSNYEASTGSAGFTVGTEQTSLSYTGGPWAVDGQPITLSGVLTTDDPAAGTALADRDVNFVLGSGSSEQTCDGTTDTTGTASCTIASVSQPTGPVAVSASYGGDPYYSAATASSGMSVASAPAGGVFAVGDISAGAPTIGGSVTFWGAQWSSANALSGGAAPAAMKGFVHWSGPVACGAQWTTTTGDSSSPPAALPSDMEVIVPSHVTQSGAQLSGDVAHIVIVQSGAGYAADPGQAGAGTIVGQLC